MNLPRALVEPISKIDNFFFAPYSPYPLALFRILLGLLMLDTVIEHLTDDIFLYYGPNAVVPLNSMACRWWQFNPVFDLIALFPYTNATYVAFFGCFIFACVLVVLGVFTRFTVPIAYLMLLSLHKECPFNLNGGDSMMLLSMLILCFGRSGDALSFDSLLKSLKKDWRVVGFVPPLQPIWVVRMLQMQLTLAYLDTFLWKASGTKWLDGTAVYYATRMQDFMRFPLPFFMDNLIFLSLLTWGTLIIEAWMFSLIWFRKTRYTVLALALMMHFGIDLFINLPVFEWVFMSMFILFVYPDDLAKAAAWMRQKVTTTLGPASVLAFDGKCILCVRGVGFLHRLDLFRRIELIDFTNPKNHDRLIDFDLARAQTEMLFSTKNGWIGGFRAFREVAKRLPLLWIFVPLMYFPGMTIIGDALYKKVAANRYLLFGRCDDGYCEIHKGGAA